MTSSYLQITVCVYIRWFYSATILKSKARLRWEELRNYR